MNDTDACHGRYWKQTIIPSSPLYLGVHQPVFETQHPSRNRTITPAFLDIVYLIT
jgi:hypothetical protein